MNNTSKTLRASIATLAAAVAYTPTSASEQEADIIVYGGTSAGIAAAIQAKRMGHSVIVVEPYEHIGGLSTGGLGQTDIGNKQVIGGIAREFYRGIRAHYSEDESWIWQKRSEYRDGGQTKTLATEDTMWTFEPSAASIVIFKMMDKEGIQVITNEKLDRSKNGVTKSGSRIQSFSTLSGNIYSGKIFIDATYEGDLLAAAGVSYAVGRESNTEFEETINGVQTDRYTRTIDWHFSVNSQNHQIEPGVSAFVIEGDRSSGVLPFINPNGPGIEGSGDFGVQAYCYRATLTNHPDNRVPFAKPDNYDEFNYELLFRHLEAGGNKFWINSAMPNRKTDTNNGGGFSSDFIGQNFKYPEASYEKRETILQEHKDYQLGLYWSLANHPRVPQKIRDYVSQWGLPKDEYPEYGNWSPQLYVREARRMMGQYVMTQKNCEGIDVVEDSVGMGAYGMDSHHVQRYVDANGHARNEGNVQADVKAPYPISYQSLLPKQEEADNLLVPVCVSSTHIAFGSIRMEPVFMVLGQSAATAACLALDQDISLSELNYADLRERLLADNQILEN